MKKAFRITLCLLLLAAYLPLTGIHPAQAATGSGQTVLINDDFESSTLGALPAGYSTPIGSGVISAFSSTNNTTVINSSNLKNTWGNTSTTLSGNNTNVLWINDGASRGGFSKSFTPVTINQGVTAELRFMQPTKAVGDTYMLELLDSSLKLAASYQVTASPVTIKSDIWYNVKFVADVLANKADLYINGVYQKNVNFSTPVTDIAYINFRMAGSTASPAYVDDIKVIRQDVVIPESLTYEIADKRVDLTWNAASGAESYNIYRSTLNSPFELVGSSTTNSYSDLGLVNEQEYSYKVTTVNSNGESDFSNTVTAEPLYVIKPANGVSDLKATVRDGQVTISWGAIPNFSDKAPTYYKLERSTNPDGAFVTLTTNGNAKLSATTYLDTNLLSGANYYYRVTPGNAGGWGPTSMLSNIVPEAPVQTPVLSAAEAGNGKVDLSWTSVTEATYYQVKRSTVNGGPYTAVSGAVNGTTFTDSTAVNGTAYYYVVTASDGKLESMISNQLKAKPYAPVAGAPGKPTGFQAVANDSSVSLSWNAVEGAASYKVKRASSSTGNGPYTTVGTVTQATYLDATVTNGTTYYYVVSALNASGAESAETDELAVQPAKVLYVDKNAAANGSTVFNTIQSAVNTISSTNTKRTIISIAPGTYTEKVVVAKPYVSLVGSGMGVTKIVYGDYAGTSATAGKPGNTGNTFLSQTVEVTADYFNASNLTIENTSGPRNEVAQAIALSLKSDMVVLESVELLGYQDTLYNGLSTVTDKNNSSYGKGREYIHNSIIQGDVDFIFGEATAVVLDNVRMVLVSNVPEGASAGGHVTAGAQKNTTDKGYVILNSQIVDGASAKGSYDLGRGWKDYARVSFINTSINSNNFLGAGWATVCAGACVQNYFSEYNSYGTGANATARIISTELTGAEASVTVPSVFDYAWNPSVRVIMPKVVYMPEVVATNTTFDLNPVYRNDVSVTVNSSVYGFTGITNNGVALSASDYSVNGNTYTLKKEYLANLGTGTITLQFQFGTVQVPLTVYVKDSTSTDIGRQVLAPNDGWGSYPNGTRGGADADANHVYVVTKRSELLKALNSSSSIPKIIYVKGTIDMNVDENDNPVGMDYYKDPAYDFDAYLAAYDPAVWGRDKVPEGTLETARAASETKQANQIKIPVGSNTTIVGLPGANAKILGGNLSIQNVDNVIIRNIEFQNTFDYFPQWDPTDGSAGNWNSAFDMVTVKGATHLWVDHNTFSDGSGRDDYINKVYFGRQYQQHDGTLDMTNASDLITVSYNYFHDHDKNTLVGGSDGYVADEGKLRITFHHNFYKNVTQRAPRVRFGQVHLYNNLYEGSYSDESYPFLYAIGVGYHSQVYAQNNYFVEDSSVSAAGLIQINGDAYPTFTDVGTMLNGQAVDISSNYSNIKDVTWTPTLYTTLDDTANVPQAVKTQAGVYGGDMSEPVWSSSNVLSAYGITDNSITLKWTAASDNKSVAGYKVYSVTNGTFKELASLSGSVTTYQVSNLTANTAYNFTVRAFDPAANWSATAPVLTVSTTGGSDGTTSGGSSTASTGTTTSGSTSTTGTANPTGTTTSSNTTSGTDAASLSSAATVSAKDGVVTVTVDASKAAELVSKAAANTDVFQVDVKETGNTVKVELASEVLKTVAAKASDAVLKVQTDTGAYSLPAKLAEESGAVKLTITIEKAQGEQAAAVQSAAAQLGVKTVTEPVEFSVTAETADGKKQDINTFNTYVERTIKLSGSVNPKTAAGVMYNPETKLMTPVPTVFNGSEATIMRRGNSIYTVIDNPKTFSDMTGHWAKSDVETLASKLIVNGSSATEYAPNRDITRAEFAAILVRALGLNEVSATGFSDVTAKDWFSGAVGAAYKAGLVTGFEDGTFHPNANITREEMVVMIVRALKLGGHDSKANVKLLDQFADRSGISGWSKDAVAVSLEAGIIQGKSETTFAAKDQATRAEAAAMLKRMLVSLNFINP